MFRAITKQLKYLYCSCCLIKPNNKTRKLNVTNNFCLSDNILFIVQKTISLSTLCVCKCHFRLTTSSGSSLNFTQIILL